MEITTSSIRELAWRCEEFLDERAEPLTVSYPGSLALCILDALFATGSHPKAVDNVVDRYIARHGRDDGAKSLRYSIAAAADLLGVDDRVVNRIVWQASHRRILSKRTQEDLFLHRCTAEWSELSDAEFVAGSAGVFDDEDESEALEREREAEFHLGSVRSLPELMPVPQPVPDERGPAPF